MAMTEQAKREIGLQEHTREAMIRAIVETHESPAEWSTAVRRIAEASGLRPEAHVVFCGTTLETQCFEVVTAAAKGACKGGIPALREAISAYAPGQHAQMALVELGRAAERYACSTNADTPDAAAVMARAALKYAEIVAARR